MNCLFKCYQSNHLFILLLLTAFFISGCKEDNRPNGQNVSPIYDEMEISAASGLMQPSPRFVMTSDNLLVVYDQKDTVCRYVYLNGDGQPVKEIICDFEGNGRIFTLDPRDNLYILVQNETIDSTTKKLAEVVRRLVVYNHKGEKITDKSLGKITLPKKQDYLILDMAVDLQENIYIANIYDNIEVLSANGKNLRSIEIKGCRALKFDGKNKLYLGGYEMTKGKHFLCGYDTDSRKFIWEINPGRMVQQMFYHRMNHSIYLLAGDIIKQYDAIGGKELGDILNLKQTGMVDCFIHTAGMGMDEAGRFFLLDYFTSMQNNRFVLYRYTQSLKEQSPKRQTVITISHLYSWEPFLWTAVGKFQREHPEIKIQVEKSFDSNDLSGGAVSEYRQILNTRIMAGKGPDIINLDRLPYRAYIEKNILVDLGALMSKDRRFHLQDYYTNIFDACKVNGHLYVLPIGFSFNVLLGNKLVLNEVGAIIDDRKWTWRDFAAIADKVKKDLNDDGFIDRYALCTLDREQFIYQYFLRREINRFVDVKANRANFNSPGFIRSLEEAMLLFQSAIFHPSISQRDIRRAMSGGSVVFMDFQLKSYLGLKLAQVYVQNNADLFLYPGTGGGGGEFQVKMPLALNRWSKHQKEAWEFIKYVISEEVQTDSALHALSVNKKAQSTIVKMQMEATAKGEASGSIGSEESFVFSPLTSGEKEKIDKFVASLRDSGYIDPEISRIVIRETARFYGGERTAEETAKIIQSKVSTYLME